MKMTKNDASKTRAVALPGSSTAKHRGETYKHAFSRINQANSAEFHLESITIIESLISDRLESRISFLFSRDFSFKTLGELIKKSKNAETDPELKSIILEEIEPWRLERNSALHEMAKIADGDTRAWADKYAALGNIAHSGLTILKKLQKRMRQLKRKTDS